MYSNNHLIQVDGLFINRNIKWLLKVEQRY
jgi:hypothetical protein